MEETLKTLIGVLEEIAATCPAGRERNCWTRLLEELQKIGKPKQVEKSGAD